MKIFFKKNYKTFIGLFIVTTVISVIYFIVNKSGVETNIIDSIASILAFPSFILSFIVLKVIDIKPENLDAYYRVRRMSDNTKRGNEKKAEEAFEEKLNEIQNLNRKYSLYLQNKLIGSENSQSLIKTCRNGCHELKGFFKETQNHIFDGFLPGIQNLGELKAIDNRDVFIIENKDKDQLSEVLSRLKPEIFDSDVLNEEEKQLLSLLFDDAKGLMIKYLETCVHAYNEIKENR